MNEARFIWFNKNIFIMSLVCGGIWEALYGTEQALLGMIIVYFACLALWNEKEATKDEEL